MDTACKRVTFAAEIGTWNDMAQSCMALSKLPIPILQDRPRDGQQGVGGQLGAEARIWDHQRPLGVSVLRQRGDSWGLGEPGGDGRLRLRQGVVMPFIESTWTYFFFIFFW